MPEQLSMNFEESEQKIDIVNSMFRHNKNIGYNLKDFSESLNEFKKYFDDRYHCEKSTLTSTQQEVSIELVIDSKESNIIKVTSYTKLGIVSYIHSINGSVVEAVSGDLKELFPEVYK
jgi:hypothetical protein